MDLGATVCTPRKPNCLICPWMGPCHGRAEGLQDVLPYKRAKAPRPTRYGVAFWIERCDGTVLVQRRPEKGLLGGMSEIPSTDWSEAGVLDDPAAHAPVRARWTRLPGLVRHTFTHFHLELEVWVAHETAGMRPSAADAGRWVARADLAWRGSAKRHEEGGGARRGKRLWCPFKNALAGPLPRPNHPQGTIIGWLGRGRGPARE